MSMPSVIDAVEFRREQYNLSCEQWAYCLRMQPSHYSEFVRGKRPLPKRAMAHAFAYGVPPEALFQALPSLGSADIDRRLAQLRKGIEKPMEPTNV